MDDTDTSHLQSPDATLPASSLANDLKILLTYSKRAEGGWVALQRVQKGANLKESSGGGCSNMRAYIENLFLYFGWRLLPNRRDEIFITLDKS